MRVRYVGYAGERPPVPTSEIVTPIDPNPPPPLDPDDPSIPDPISVVLEDGDIFHKLTYLALGYNRFDVMCIGGAGGRGGSLAIFEEAVLQPEWIRYQRTAPFTEPVIVNGGSIMSGIKQFARVGGGGGGGGLHRIKGRLALLPTNVPVVVGDAGADGTHPAPGADGEVSSFGGVICRASGGKGGRAYGDESVSTAGKGGVGNAELAGGGANAGADGTWDGTIGQGGGGSGTPVPGGKGSYSAGDPTTSGPGGAVGTMSLIRDEVALVSTVTESGTQNQAGTGTWVNYYSLTRTTPSLAVIPGAGGGAKTYALNGETEQHGAKVAALDGKGAVIIRLSYVIT